MMYRKNQRGRELLIVTSRRTHGPMGWSSGRGRAEPQNHLRFFRLLGIPAAKTFRGQQVHGTRVRIIRESPKYIIFPKTDALITNRLNIFLAVLHADCFPVFFYDSALSVVGIAHAGWRGTVKGIIQSTVRAFRRFFKVIPKELYVIIGPGIQQCHFEVWPEGRHKDIEKYFNTYRPFVQRRHGRFFVDLAGIIRSQLRTAGVLQKNILSVKECTYHMPKRYFSYRRDAGREHPRGYGNMISVIGVKITHEKKTPR